MPSASGQIPATRGDNSGGAETAGNAKEDDEDDADEGRHFSEMEGRA